MAQRDQTTITLDNVYGIATTTLRESSSKASTAVTATKEDKGFNKPLKSLELLTNLKSNMQSLLSLHSEVFPNSQSKVSFNDNKFLY
jgi:hypothetical protein